MREEHTSNGYQFRYSAEENKAVQDEVERIRNQYASQYEGGSREMADKLNRLRMLDKKAKNPALIISLCLGIGGTLVLGTGMSLALAMGHMAAGIVVGVLGMGILGVAYPAHQYLLAKGKEKYGEVIRELSDELLDRRE